MYQILRWPFPAAKSALCILELRLSRLPVNFSAFFFRLTISTRSTAISQPLSMWNNRCGSQRSEWAAREQWQCVHLKCSSESERDYLTLEVKVVNVGAASAMDSVINPFLAFVVVNRVRKKFFAFPAIERPTASLPFILSPLECSDRTAIGTWGVFVCFGLIWRPCQIGGRRSRFLWHVLKSEPHTLWYSSCLNENNLAFTDLKKTIPFSLYKNRTKIWENLSIISAHKQTTELIKYSPSI